MKNYPYPDTPAPSRFSLTGRPISTSDAEALDTLKSLAKEAIDALPSRRFALVDHLPTRWDALDIPRMDFLREAVTVKGRLRTRAACPLCGRDGFLLHERAGTLSAHGYQRQGGWQSGECAGSHRTPEAALAIALDRLSGIRSAAEALTLPRVEAFLESAVESGARATEKYAHMDLHALPRYEAKRLREYLSLRDEGMDSMYLRRAVRAREDILRSQWACLWSGLGLLQEALDMTA